MARLSIEKEYFSWLLDIVCTNTQKKKYSKLFWHLYQTEFYSTLEMDDNRAADGLELRGDFAHDIHMDVRIVNYEIDRPCSVLEMMVGLAKRCEDGIMGDDDYGDRTPVWFWKMMEIDSTGFEFFTDDRFSYQEVNRIIENLLEHKYSKNGKGGWFYIPEYKGDLRKVEIWYQLNYYLCGLIEY